MTNDTEKTACMAMRTDNTVSRMAVSDNVNTKEGLASIIFPHRNSHEGRTHFPKYS